MTRPSGFSETAASAPAAADEIRRAPAGKAGLAQRAQPMTAIIAGTFSTERGSRSTAISQRPKAKADTIGNERSCRRAAGRWPGHSWFRGRMIQSRLKAVIEALAWVAVFALISAVIADVFR